VIAHLSSGRPPLAHRSDMLNIAYHEAGHAVIAERYLLATRRATVIAAPPFFGWVDLAPELWPQFPPDTFVEVVVSMYCAGALAQEHASNRYGFPLRGHDSSDQASARCLLVTRLGADSWHDEVVERAFDDWRSRTGSAVHASWPWIERVAQALMSRKVLTRSEILELK
jgi:hypothetical protein